MGVELKWISCPSIKLRHVCYGASYLNLINTLARLVWAAYVLVNHVSSTPHTWFMILVAALEMVFFIPRIGFHSLLLLGLPMNRCKFIKLYLIFTIVCVEWIVIEMFLKVPAPNANVDDIVIARLTDFAWNMYCLLLISKYLGKMKTDS